MTSTPVTPEQWLELRQESASGLPDVVASVGLPAVLLPYQQRAVRLLDEAGTAVLVIEKSRRIGLTWALASAAVLRAAKVKPAGGMDVMYISYSQDMTREFIDACAMWARVFSIAAGEAEEIMFDDHADGEATRAIKAFRIGFASGFQVTGLSSAPRSLRGRQGLVIIDEAAFVDQLAELMKAALAFLMWGGQVVVCSTHNGVDNPFNLLVQDIAAGRSRFRHIRIDFNDALGDGLYRRIALVKGEAWSPDQELAWRASIVAYYGDQADEELFCVPAMSSGAWLPAALIERRMTGDGRILRFELPEAFLSWSAADQARAMEAILDQVKRAVDGLDPERQHAAGFDFARLIDLSVLPVLEIGPTLIRTVRLVIEMRRMPYEEQRRIAEYVIGHMPRPVGAAFDATGSGEYIAEALGRKFGIAAKVAGEAGGLIAAIKLSQEWYRVEMPPLKAAFEDGTITLTKDDLHLIDLRAVHVIRGVAQVAALRTGEKGQKRHGDFAVGLALAYFASRMRYAEYGYQAQPRGWTGAGPGRGRERGRMSDLPDFEADDFKARAWWQPPLGARLQGDV